MRELQYLTEKDLKYFYKLEEKGEAVIIRIDEEALLSLDPQKLFDESKKGEEIDEKELQQWLKDHSEELRQRYQKNLKIVKENRRMKGENPCPDKKMTLATRLTQVELDEEQVEVLNHAIQQGLTEEEILLLLKDKMTSEKMKELCDLLLYLKAEDN